MPTATKTTPMPPARKDPKKSAPKLAKSKDPDFRASTVYLRRKTHAACDYELSTRGDKRDLSELIEDLMQGWLHSVSPSKYPAR
jgi:hypothetical protein